MQCESYKKDANLEKEIRDIVSTVERFVFQLGTQPVKDSALLYVSGYISRPTRRLLRSLNCSGCS